MMERLPEVRLVDKNERNVEAMLRIDREAFDDLLLNRWVIPPFLRNGKVFGLFGNDDLKGFAIFVRTWDDPSVAYLQEIAVEKECQGRGCATLLLMESLRHLRRDGISRLGLTVDAMNERALHIYQHKFGFKFVEHRKDEYGRGRDRLYLEMELETWGDGNVGPGPSDP